MVVSFFYVNKNLIIKLLKFDLPGLLLFGYPHGHQPENLPIK